MDRRSLLIGSVACASGPGARSVAADPALSGLARRGGVLLIRHASTEPGLGDPPGFKLGQCSTQRNLSEAGRIEARAIGKWFYRHGLQAQAVLSSQWCRCQETAQLAFGGYQDWPALNSTFRGQGQHDEQVRSLRERLQILPAGSLEVWVTHQVIMTGLTGAYPSMGEGFLVDNAGRLLARGFMTANT